MHLKTYCGAVLKHWMIFLTGLVSLFVSFFRYIAGQISKSSPSASTLKHFVESPALWLVIGLGFLFVAFYRAWLDQYKIVEEIKAPDVLLNYSSGGIDSENRDPALIRITNTGDRAIYDIRIEPMTRHRQTASFSKLDVLAAKDSADIECTLGAPNAMLRVRTGLITLFGKEPNKNSEETLRLLFSFNRRCFVANCVVEYHASRRTVTIRNSPPELF